MKAAEGNFGRVFILRMEHGDVLPDCIEEFAAAKGVRVGCAMLVGGIGEGKLVVVPRESDARPPKPMSHKLKGAHEITALGVIAPGDDGKPTLHMHGALGRSDNAVVGCLRKGVKTWLTGEVVLYEITGTAACRVMDPGCGFSLLEPLGVPGSDSPNDAADPGSGALTAPADSGARKTGLRVDTLSGARAAAAPALDQPYRGNPDGATRVIYLFNAEMH